MSLFVSAPKVPHCKHRGWRIYDWDTMWIKISTASYRGPTGCRALPCIHYLFNGSVVLTPSTPVYRRRYWGLRGRSKSPNAPQASVRNKVFHPGALCFDTTARCFQHQEKSQPQSTTDSDRSMSPDLAVTGLSYPQFHFPQKLPTYAFHFRVNWHGTSDPRGNSGRTCTRFVYLWELHDLSPQRMAPG